MWPAKHIILLSIAVQVAQAWRHVVKNRAEATLFREGQPPTSISTPRASRIMYGHSVWASVTAYSDESWLTGAIEADEFTHPFENVHTRVPSHGSIDKWTYEWRVRSNAGNGNIGSNSEADPAAGQCVEYGDMVMFQVQSRAKRWLSGGRGKGNEIVVTRDLVGNAFESTITPTYSWQVRSNAGLGNVDAKAETDVKTGQCVSYRDFVFLQVQGLGFRWLSGGRDDGQEGVYTRNHLDGGYEQTIGLDYYRWKLGHAPTILRVTGWWFPSEYLTGKFTKTTTIGWSKTVSDELLLEFKASASAGFTIPFPGALMEIGGEMSGAITKRLASSIDRTTNYTYTHEVDAANGTHIWTWMFYLDRGDNEQGFITTDATIQADARPNCLPGEGIGKYVTCQSGGCIENCLSLKVGDHVLITESARRGEITEQDIYHDRPFRVVFSDGGSPSGGWYAEGSLSLDQITSM